MLRSPLVSCVETLGLPHNVYGCVLFGLLGSCKASFLLCKGLSRGALLQQDSPYSKLYHSCNCDTNLSKSHAKGPVSPLESNSWNRGILDVEPTSGGCIGQIEAGIVREHHFVTRNAWCKHFCCTHTVLFLYVRTIASLFRVFLRLVSHGPFQVPPRWHFSVRVNQKKFYSPPTLVKANI